MAIESLSEGGFSFIPRLNVIEIHVRIKLKIRKYNTLPTIEDTTFLNRNIFNFM